MGYIIEQLATLEKLPDGRAPTETLAKPRFGVGKPSGALLSVDICNNPAEGIRFANVAKEVLALSPVFVRRGGSHPAAKCLARSSASIN